jgi:hypothetical protein
LDLPNSQYLTHDERRVVCSEISIPGASGLGVEPNMVAVDASHRLSLAHCPRARRQRREAAHHPWPGL